jgi:histidyl-tRNA synthetase
MDNSPARGTRDLLPATVAVRDHVLARITEVYHRYGYQRIETPALEDIRRLTGGQGGENEKLIFKVLRRGLSELPASLDELADLGLRFDLTVPLTRFYGNNQATLPMPFRSFQFGPVWRAERPQKGRYRQFNQIDVEAIGFAGPDVDIELIALTARLWKLLGLTRVKLQINSLGTPEARRAYRELLTGYFRQHFAALDADSQRRLEGNPLRILDSKLPTTQAIVANAPVLTEHLDAESTAHFAELRAGLDALGIPYAVNPRLVRGLDYYSRTVFEWITDALGAQDAVCSGGRYDGLIAQMGGEPTPAVGFAMGVERIVELVKLAGMTPATAAPDVFVMAQGDAAQRAALGLAERLRDAFPGRGIAVHCGQAKFKTQFRRADESGARLALIVGDDELARGVVALKPLRGADTTQTEYPVADLTARVDEFFRRST